MPVPSRCFVRGLRRQPPAPDLVTKLQRFFPRLGEATPVVELCIEDGGFPHDFDCGGFALGDFALTVLGGREISEVEDSLGKLGLQKVDLLDPTAVRTLPGESAIVATFAIGEKVRHFALGYLDESSKPEATWFSKFGKGFPVLLHTIDEVNGAGYGSVYSYWVCIPARCGEPRWKADSVAF